MPTDLERRRVLVAARAADEEALRPLFDSAALAGWEPVEADTFHRARFTLQHTACDVLLVDEGLCTAEGPEGLAWVARQREAPLVFLAGDRPEVCALAYERGASLWVPRRAALDHPPLLAAALKRAAQEGDLVRSQRRGRESQLQCRRQVDHLIGLLWRSVPVDTQTQWCSQRHVLERLQEEVARSGRHGSPLSVAIGEVHTSGEDPAGPDAGQWLPRRLNRVKRRCDVAGQYGLQGFMLLMIHTPPHGAVSCCRRLQRALEEPALPPAGPRGLVRACFGLASYSDQAATPQALLRAAEDHLEMAKAEAVQSILGE
jgi:diguanylate cyclase (GGDEF)-like protein